MWCAQTATDNAAIDSVAVDQRGVTEDRLAGEDREDLRDDTEERSAMMYTSG